jgi:hypothetical protein
LEESSRNKTYVANFRREAKLALLMEVATEEGMAGDKT